MLLSMEIVPDSIYGMGVLGRLLAAYVAGVITFEQCVAAVREYDMLVTRQRDASENLLKLITSEANVPIVGYNNNDDINDFVFDDDDNCTKYEKKEYINVELNVRDCDDAVDL